MVEKRTMRFKESRAESSNVVELTLINAGSISAATSLSLIRITDWCFTMVREGV